MSKITYLMILKQKVLLAKLIFVISIFYLNLSFADDSVNVTDNDTNAISSPFSILKENLQSNNDDKDLLIVKQAINSGDVWEFDTAKIRLLEYNTGLSTEYIIKRDENWQYNDNMYIRLHYCWISKEVALNPVNMALISVANGEKTTFKGWIFSKNFALSLPKIEDHFIYLTACG